MNKKIRYSLLTPLLLCLATSCQADIIYSNLGPGDVEAAGVNVIGSAAAAILGTPVAQNGTQLFPSSENSIATSFTMGVDFFPPGSGFSPLFDTFIYANIQSVVNDGENHQFTINVPVMQIAEIGQALLAPN